MNPTKETGRTQVIAEKMRADLPEGATIYTIARGTNEYPDARRAITSICSIQHNHMVVLDERISQLLDLPVDYSVELQEAGKGIGYGDPEEGDAETELVAAVGNALWNDPKAYKHQSL